ncbi:SagB/ThcOx family dehydrogenase [Candidatus Gracilibacteria bacterium]|nr:SagB/ThcOx family dehydrogenase [Candidatus Gracilibacteria bacterium]
MDTLNKELDIDLTIEDLNGLVGYEILIDKDEYNKISEEIRVWVFYKWMHALYYYYGSKKPNYIEPNHSNWNDIRIKTHKNYIADTGLPELYKKIKSIKNIKLGKVLDLPDGSFLDLLYARKSVRNFNNEKVTFDELSTIFYIGLRGVKEVRENISNYMSDLSQLKQSEYIAFEFYIMIYNVEGIEPGIYHYNLENNEFCLIKKGNYSNEVTDIQMGQKVIERSKFSIYIGVDFYRYMWRYRYSKKYTLLLMQVGKVAQQIITISQVLGIGSFMSPAIKDSKIEKLIGLDGINESVVYFLSFGKYNKEKGSYMFSNGGNVLEDIK